MSEQYVDKIINDLISREGGYVNHPNDKGGPTKYGITQAVAKDWSYTGDMKDFPLATAINIYKDRYWRKPGFAQVSTVSVKIAEELFDTGVNMGPVKAINFFISLINTLNNQGKLYNDIPRDSGLTFQHISALADFLRVRGSEGENVFLKGLNCLQGARYIELAEIREKNEAFLYGWLKERVKL